MNIFLKIKALYYYIISTPHYLYTRYTAAKQRYREEQRLMNKLLVNEMNLIKYKGELFELTKYSAYLKASVTCFDELKGRTPTVELGEHKSYSIFMKSYVEQDLEMLQKYKSELESLNIQFLDEERGDLIIRYSDRISVQKSYILSCVNTVKDVDKSTNKEITSNSNIQLKDTVEAPLNEENQVNQLNIELNDIKTKLQDEILKNTHLTEEASSVKIASDSRINELEKEIIHNNTNYDWLEGKYDTLEKEYATFKKDKEIVDSTRDKEIHQSNISKIASLNKDNLKLSSDLNMLQARLTDKEQDARNQINKLTEDLRVANERIRVLEDGIKLIEYNNLRLLRDNEDYRNSNTELNRIMNGVTNGKMTYIANTTKLLHTTYNQLEALRNDYIMKAEVTYMLYSTILRDVITLGELIKRQGELESAVIMYNEDMQKENDLKRLESAQGNSTEVAVHITRYNTAKGHLKVHEEEARINQSNIEVMNNSITDNTDLLDDQRTSLTDRVLDLENNLAEIRKLLSHIKRDPQMLNEEAEEDRATHSHHVLTVNETLLEDIAIANNEFIKNASDNGEQAANKMRKSILQGPSYLVSTRRQDRSVTEPSSRPSTSRSTSSSKSGTLNLNKNDSSPLARKESHKKDVARVSSIKKKDDTALLNISQEITSGQNNSFATVTDTPTKGTIMGPNEESVGL
jgi:hypothetical protein